jgi:hypothetical protein
LTHPGVRALGLALLAAAVVACRTPAGPPLAILPGEEERVRGWVAAASESGARRVGLRAIGHLRLEGPGGSGRVKQVILAERPASLRFESLNFLGQTASLLVTDGEHFAFYDGERIERGRVTPTILRDTVGLDVEPAEAVDLLMASPSLPDAAPAAVFGRANERVAHYPMERVHFDGAGQLEGVERLDDNGQVRWRAQFGSWRDLPGGRYPYAMVFSFPTTQLRAELEFDDVELNPVLDQALFSLPEGRE